MYVVDNIIIKKKSIHLFEYLPAKPKHSKMCFSQQKYLNQHYLSSVNSTVDGGKWNSLDSRYAPSFKRWINHHSKKSRREQNSEKLLKWTQENTKRAGRATGRCAKRDNGDLRGWVFFTSQLETIHQFQLHFAVKFWITTKLDCTFVWEGNTKPSFWGNDLTFQETGRRCSETDQTPFQI